MNNRRREPECIGDGGGPAERVDNVICGGHVRNIAQIAAKCNSKIELSAIDCGTGLRHSHPMLSTAELLNALDVKLGRGKGRALAECLGLDSAAATRIYKGERALKLDEAKKLVERFNLDDAPQPGVAPLTIPVARLLILYACDYLGLAVRSDDPRVEELARDIQAFSRFSLDPEIRENPVAANGFFQGMRQSRDPKA